MGIRAIGAVEHLPGMSTRQRPAGCRHFMRGFAEGLDNEIARPDRNPAQWNPWRKGGDGTAYPGRPWEVDTYWNDHPPPVAVSTGFMQITGI